MNDLQLQKAKQAFYAEARKVGAPFGKLTPELEQRENELGTYAMVNSVIAYDWVDKRCSAKELLDNELYNRYHSYLQPYVDAIGYDRVLTIIEEQLGDVEDVRRNVHVDGEGVGYNSIVWKQ